MTHTTTDSKIFPAFIEKLKRDGFLTEELPELEMVKTDYRWGFEAFKKDISAARLYRERYGVGLTRYSVFFHDGLKTHKDGSKFFDMRLFTNKRKKESFIRSLRESGYKLAA